MGNRNWLVFADRSRCHHAEALYELGFLNWKKGKNYKMNVGDYVYIFVSDERRIKFKTEVTDVNCKREDNKFWRDKNGLYLKEAPGEDLAYKLEYRNDYEGTELDEAVLRKHGFNGGRSFQKPMCNNPELFSYIEKVFASLSL